MSTVLWLASNNQKKVVELQRMLKALDCTIRTPDQLKEKFEPVEDQPDFAGNARKKATMLAKLAHGIALSDDSGLCVNVLGGRPGVLSARYGGPGLDDRGRMLRLLESLRAVPQGQRQAHFTCHLCLCGADGRVLTTVEERCEGTLLEEPSGDSGFGYDPIFVPREYGTDPTRSFANLDAANKDRVSHRGKALRALLARLPGLLAR